MEATVVSKSDPTGTDTRKVWLSSWADSEPLASIREARSALIAHFGVALSTDTIAEILRQKRAHLKTIATKVGSFERPDELLHSVSEEARRLQALGIRRIEIGNDGTFTYEAFGKFH